jgi:teichuronic acid biosynthesis glycosyltransferase TuaC
MRILFVCSGNSKNFEIPPFIKEQGTSLAEQGVDVSYFPILGKGVKGYLRKAKELKNHQKKNPVDLIHTHYTLSGWVAVCARPKIPIVLSLMGTDAYGEYSGPRKVVFKSRILTLLTFLIQPFVDAIISKSNHISTYVYRKGISHIIPNGIRLEHFKLYPPEIRNELGLSSGKKYILFLGDKNYKRKNFTLLENAFRLMNNNDVELLAPYPISHDKVVKYLNAADVFIMTAFMEGSPNVIKEAMACNCPIVATDVGDVKWVMGDTEGCYITSFETEDVAEKINLALAFSKEKGRTKGRERILELGLDSETVAKRILGVYNEALEKGK